MKVSKLAVLAWVIGSLGLGACGKVPSGYKGTFRDVDSGVTIILKGSKGIFSDHQGRKLESKSADFKFENLVQGGNGIFIHDHPQDSSLLEVFWLFPKLATRQEAGGLIWFESEILYSLFNKKTESKLESFDLTHCEAGTVLLDPATRNFQIGCGSGEQTYHLIRVK